MRWWCLALCLPGVAGRWSRKLSSDYDFLRAALAKDEATNVVRVKLSGTDDGDATVLADAVGGEHLRRVFRHGGKHEARHAASGLHRWWRFEMENASSALGAIEAMLGDLDLDARISVCELVLKPHFYGGYEPDDAYYAAYQADVFEAMRVPEAWDAYRGSESFEVVVQVTDTGTELWHPDMADRLWTNAGEICGNGVDDDDNGYVDDCHAGADDLEAHSRARVAHTGADDVEADLGADLGADGALLAHHERR